MLLQIGCAMPPMGSWAVLDGTAVGMHDLKALQKTCAMLTEHLGQWLRGPRKVSGRRRMGPALLLGQKGADLEEQMGRSACVLVMEYIPGRPLLGEQEPFQASQILRTAEDLGRCGNHLCQA